MSARELARPLDQWGRIDLTPAQKALLRDLLREAVRDVRRHTPNPDDRLASFFGWTLGRAGVDAADDLMAQLLAP